MSKLNGHLKGPIYLRTFFIKTLVHGLREVHTCLEGLKWKEDGCTRVYKGYILQGKSCTWITFGHTQGQRSTNESIKGVYGIRMGAYRIVKVAYKLIRAHMVA